MRRTLVAMAAGLLLAAGTFGGDASADELQRGRELFALCAQCHGENAEGNRLFLAPAIAGLSQWYIEAQLGYFKIGARGLHPDDVAGMRMAPMSRTLLKEGDIPSVAAYVASLPAERPTSQLEGGNAEAGKTLYAVCAACHGADGTGNQQMGSPPLRYASDWYLYSQLEKFRAGIRGTDPRNPNGAVMRPMAMTLPDDQALKDVVAYIGTLSNQESARASEER